MNTPRCPGQDTRYLRPHDVAEATCPDCGHRTEFWPGDLMRPCPGCGRRLPHPEGALKCLAWCSYAAECLEAMQHGGQDALRPVREELLANVSGPYPEDAAKLERRTAVLEFVEEIGRRERRDMLVLVPAAILHDTYWSDPDNGLGWAEQMLAAAGLPQAVRNRVLRLITHSRDRGWMAENGGGPLFDAVTLAGTAPEDRGHLQDVMLTRTGRELSVRNTGGSVGLDRARRASWPHV
jgi:hypothetical protein